MRLLHYNGTAELSLTNDLADDGIPPYAILSHTWGDDQDEITLQELGKCPDKAKSGYAKLLLCGEQTKRDGLHYFWVDTCCIDKTSSSELSKNINSMFRYYQNSAQCYVYLSDVSVGQWTQDLKKSKWFTRGWTLQELLAPRTVHFYSAEWSYLGSKETLLDIIHNITAIPDDALRGVDLSIFSENERMRWTIGRNTKEREDKAYSLFGIFGISMTPRYGEGEEAAFSRLRNKIQKKSKPSLQATDHSVREYYLSDGCLDIERLSGQTLHMESCYINLGIIDTGRNVDKQKSRDLFAVDVLPTRETTEAFDVLTLETLFDARPLVRGTTARPRHVIIWGRAGMGKTTLCKKILHEFLHSHLWQDLYDRIFWVPLRRLRLLGHETRSVAQLIQQVCFFDASDHSLSANVLNDNLHACFDRCLFILDGLDEISYAVDHDSPMCANLLKLMKQKNVIITSRPHRTKILERLTFDIELETIGFYPDQVDEFLERESRQHGNLENNIAPIRSFIQSHPIVESLVRIPIQLDAVCYAWKQEPFEGDQITMTLLYHAISTQLWQKDIIRLGKKCEGEPITSQQIQTCVNLRILLEPEISCLEELAFAGLYYQVAEFSASNINAVAGGQVPLLDSRLSKLSFLRSSGKLENSKEQAHHFIHLTFQDFFAAHYFVRHWSSEKSMCFSVLTPAVTHRSQNNVLVQIREFIHQHKYSTRYDHFWRFVAGLIQMHQGFEALVSFFEHLENDPIDHIGPSHQLLLARCLQEVVNHPDCFRVKSEELERQYLNWTLYEERLSMTQLPHSDTRLLTRPECPRSVFKSCFRNTDTKLRAIASLNSKPALAIIHLSELLETVRGPDNEVMRVEALTIIVKNCSHLFSEDALVDLIETAASPQRWAWMLRFTSCPIRERLKSRFIERWAACNKDPVIDNDAASILRVQPNLPNSATELCLKSLQIPDESVKQCNHAAYILQRQPELPETHIAILSGLLTSQDPTIRSRAARALGVHQSLPWSVINTLARLLQDQDQSIRYQAVSTLSVQCEFNADAFQFLAGLVNDPNPWFRLKAVKTLHSCSDPPYYAFKTLAESLRDADQVVRSNIAKFIGDEELVPDFVVEALASLLTDSALGVRASAAKSILNLERPLPDSVWQALGQMLLINSTMGRRDIFFTLSRRNELPDVIIATLLQVALGHDQDHDDRFGACDALWNFDQSNRNLTKAQNESLINAYIDMMIVDEQCRYPWYTATIPCLSTTQVQRCIPLLRHGLGSIPRLLERQTVFYKLLPTLDIVSLKEMVHFWQTCTDRHCYVYLHNGSFLIDFEGDRYTETFSTADFALLQRNWHEACRELGTPGYQNEANNMRVSGK